MGDDLILVSVSSERYLVRLLTSHIHFHIAQWNIKTWVISDKLNYFSSFSCLQHLSYASGDLMVDASFMQTLWNMNPISSGCELAEGTNLLYMLSYAAMGIFQIYTCSITKI